MGIHNEMVRATVTRLEATMTREFQSIRGMMQEFKRDLETSSVRGAAGVTIPALSTLSQEQRDTECTRAFGCVFPISNVLDVVALDKKLATNANFSELCVYRCVVSIFSTTAILR
jgi:hypothetical protein